MEERITRRVFCKTAGILVGGTLAAKLGEKNAVASEPVSGQEPAPKKEPSMSKLSQIYLEDARKNILQTKGKQVIVPSQAYCSHVYTRDSFLSCLGLNDFSLSKDNYLYFQKNQLENGQVPTSVSLYSTEIACPQEDESTLLFVIWAGLMKRKNFPVDNKAVKKALDFIKAHSYQDKYLTLPGTFRYWPDTLRFDSQENIAYVQGLYCLALRFLREMGEGIITDRQLAGAEEQYRNFYDKNLGYVSLGKTSNVSECQDVSVLLPEFFCRLFFKGRILTDEMIIRTVNYRIRTATVCNCKNEQIGIKAVCLPDGGFLPPERFFEPEALNPQGCYHNGAYWPMFSLVELSLAYAITKDQELKEVASRLMRSEFSGDKHSKEFLYLASWRLGGFDKERSGYSWNALANLALRWSKLA